MLKSVDAENLQDFIEAFVQAGFFPEDGHEQIGADGRPDLAMNGIG